MIEKPVSSPSVPPMAESLSTSLAFWSFILVHLNSELYRTTYDFWWKKAINHYELAYPGNLVKCRSVKENSDKVELTFKLQILKNYPYLYFLFLLPFFTSEVVEIFLKIRELRNSGTLVPLILVPQLFVCSLILGPIWGLDNVHNQSLTFLQTISLNINICHTVNLFPKTERGLEKVS